MAMQCTTCGEHAGHGLLRFLVGRLASPLAQELAVLVEHHDAPVAVAVGDVDVAVARIDHDGRTACGAGRAPRCCPRRAACRRPNRTCRACRSAAAAFRPGAYFWTMASPLPATQTFLSAIDEAAVDRAGHRGLIAPGADHVAVDVELDDRGRRDRGFLLLVGDVAPVDHVDVVLLARADAAELAGDPVLRQVLRPGWRRPRISARSGPAPAASPNANDSAAADAASRAMLFMVSPPNSDDPSLEFLAAEIDRFDAAHVGDVVERIAVSTRRSAALPLASVPKSLSMPSISELFFENATMICIGVRPASRISSICRCSK